VVLSLFITIRIMYAFVVFLMYATNPAFLKIYRYAYDLCPQILLDWLQDFAFAGTKYVGLQKGRWGNTLESFIQ